MFYPALHSLDLLCARLPFHLNDIEQVNRAFQRWQRAGFPGRDGVVDLWTYCFVRRYFLVKFMKEPAYAPSDLDELVDIAFRKVDQHRQRVQHPGRYASWVSVVCKNTFLNYLRARRPLYPLVDGEEYAALAEAPPVHPDIGLVTQALLEAIERLPHFLREIAHLRFIEEYSYEEIAVRTGRPPASTRAYISKILTRFRKDAHLLAYLDAPET